MGLFVFSDLLIHIGAWSRRNRKRDFRALWLIRVNAALRDNGTTWSKFANLLKKNKISLNRKMLAELAVREPKIFDKMVKELI